jgi:hypothetical protein
MNAIQKKARVAGLLYLLIALSAPFGLLYVPNALFVAGDPTATANHLRSSEALLRAGIGSELFHQAAGIFLALTLYSLLRAVNETQAVMMVVLSVVSVPIVFLNVLNEIAALILVSGADFLSVFDRRQLDALAFLALRLHGQGLNVAGIFWGLWLFPFGILVMRSALIPRVLGVFLILAGFGNLVNSMAALLLPRSAHLVGMVAMVLEFGELPIMLWFLIGSPRPPRLDEAS